MPDDAKAFSISNINGQAWSYSQATGELKHNGEHIANGYSGSEKAKNDPKMEKVHNSGPIPHGNWEITGPPANTKEHGPYVLKLKPQEETATFGREGFLIHGDSKGLPGCASHGCIILPRATREKIWESSDRTLEVVAEPGTDNPESK